MFCKDSLAAEAVINLDKDEDSDSGEEDAADDINLSQGRAKTQPLASRKNQDSDDEEAEDESDNDEEELHIVSKKKADPSALLAFMLLGPFGTDAYGFEVSAAFSMDTEAIDENAKSGQYNTKSIKEEKNVTTEIER